MAGRSKMKYAKKRRKRRSSAVYVLLTIILMVLAALIGLSVFFRVQTINVEGNNSYAAEDIIKVSGISEGDNLIFLHESNIAAKICGEFQCVEQVRIIRSLPGEVTISITESSPVAYVYSGTERWIINENCKLLENADSAKTAGLIEVKGMSITSPIVGEIIKTDDDSSLAVEYLGDFLQEAVKQQLADKITNIDMSNAANMVFEYDGRFTVKFGRGDLAEIKLKNMVAVIETLESDEKGVIDITNENETHFIPN